MSDLWAAYVGHWNMKHLEGRSEWERARLISFFSIKPHSKNLKTPEGLFPFEWESRTTGIQKLKEDLKKVKEINPNWLK